MIKMITRYSVSHGDRRAMTYKNEKGEEFVSVLQRLLPGFNSLFDFEWPYSMGGQNPFINEFIFHNLRAYYHWDTVKYMVCGDGSFSLRIMNKTGETMCMYHSEDNKEVDAWFEQQALLKEVKEVPTTTTKTRRKSL